MPDSSIRARLLWRLVPIVVVCWALAAGLVFFGTRSELRDAFDAQSDILALTIAGLEGETIPLDSFRAELERYGGDYIVRMWAPDGELLVDSQSALADLTDGAITLEALPELGPAWTQREYVLSSGERILIARLTQETNELVLQVALTSILPLALALLGSILTAVILVRQGLRPLTTLSEALSERSATDLRRLPDETSADELRPIVAALNGLLSRISAFLDRERRFVDDAAHELRTPLSVVKAQCQAIDPNTLDDDARQRLDNIVTGVDRMASLSRQLLDQARAEQQAPVAHAIPVGPVLRSVLADLTPSAERAGVKVDLVTQADPHCRCPKEDLATICRNLIENALKFSGDPGLVQITLTDKAILIEDNGPGVPEDMREIVFDRFVQRQRDPHTVFGGGAGLGLSIVRSLAQRNDLDVTCSAGQSLSGACFRLDWTRQTA